MPTYNPNDFYPEAGKEINSSGNVVNPADSVDSNGNQGTALNTRKQTTVQTHTNVSVAANSNNDESVFHDANGYDQLSVTLMADASISMSANVLWSNDGVTVHGYDSVVPTVTDTTHAGIVPTKARYFKMRIHNGDTTNPHVMNCWAFLKA